MALQTGLKLLALAAFAVQATPSGAADNPLQTFKDWTVGCDNGRACMAVGQFTPDNYEVLTIAVERGGGRADRPAIWFRDDGDSNPTDFAVDGKPLGLRFVRRDDSTIVVAPESTDRALAALVGAGKVTTVNKPGQPSYLVSTTGASAALRWMDSAQLRAGGITALVAKGAKPASAVPASPALPIAIRRMPAKLPPPDALPAKAIGEWREKIFECEDETPNPDLVETRRLDAKTTLVMITASCASGAYNYVYIPLLVRKGAKPVIARFEGVDDAAAGEGDGLYNLYWKDKDNRILGSYMKGRGLGDCGGGTDWVWDGTIFRRVGESMMDDCRGAPGWITTYRARIVDR